ncbi:hypothetical protein [Streptacidiphilus sp. PAMC 29251]
MTSPVMIELEHPVHADCPECGEPVEFDHYVITTPEGALCQGCANDTAPGLGDLAHGLSAIRWALMYQLGQEHRSLVQQHCSNLATLAANLASGATALYTEGPNGEKDILRPGGNDPHDTIRRHVMRAVGSNR